MWGTEAGLTRRYGNLIHDTQGHRVAAQSLANHVILLGIRRKKEACLIGREGAKSSMVLTPWRGVLSQPQTILKQYQSLGGDSHT